MTKSKIHRFPKTRIATIDICSVGLQKHHIAVLMEVNVIDGSPMARFLSDISQNIQKGSYIDE